MSVDEYLQRVKKKYLSTFTLLNESEFQKGLARAKVFEERMRKRYEDQIRKISWFVIIARNK
jgi:hypothetical protein